MKIRKIFENREISEYDLQGFKDMGLNVLPSLMLYKDNKITYVLVHGRDPHIDLDYMASYTTSDYSSYEGISADNLFWHLFQNYEFDRIYRAYTIKITNKILPFNNTEIFNEINLIKDNVEYSETFISTNTLFLCYSSSLFNIEDENEKIMDIIENHLMVDDYYFESNKIEIFYTGEYPDMLDRDLVSELEKNGYTIDCELMGNLDKENDDDETHTHIRITVLNYPIK